MGAALFAVLAGLIFLARKRHNKSPKANSPAGHPQFIPPQPVPVVEPVPEAEHGPLTRPAAAQLTLALEAVRMSATLVFATLSYRLTVTNTGGEAARDLVVSGDMVSAHASIPRQEMLGEDGASLPILHRIALLEPGASEVLTGDIRLPLSAILPIQRGGQRLFVPIARVATVATAPTGAISTHQAFLVGQEPQANAKLQPFRLDLGPRLYSQVGQRPVGAA